MIIYENNIEEYLKSYDSFSYYKINSLQKY